MPCGTPQNKEDQLTFSYGPDGFLQASQRAAAVALPHFGPRQPDQSLRGAGDSGGEGDDGRGALREHQKEFRSSKSWARRWGRGEPLTPSPPCCSGGPGGFVWVLRAAAVAERPRRSSPWGRRARWDKSSHRKTCEDACGTNRKLIWDTSCLGSLPSTAASGGSS